MMSKTKTLLLTTIDNPYHPIDEMDQWLDFDTSHKYYTNQRLDKVAPRTSNERHLEEQRTVNGAILDFLRLDESGLWTAIVVDDD